MCEFMVFFGSDRLFLSEKKSELLCYIYILGYIYNCIISQLDNICLSVYLSVRTRLSREVLHLMNYAFDA